MKIHQNSLKSNISFYIQEYVNQIFSNLLLYKKLLSKKNIKDKQEQLERESPKLQLLDRENRERKLIFDNKNICILGEDPDYVLDLSLYIQQYCTEKGRLARIISLSEFCNLLQGEQINSNLAYITTGSVRDVSLAEFSTILRQCAKIFVFPLNDGKANFDYFANTCSTLYIEEICSVFGGDRILRTSLLSTLKPNEFLVITQDIEAVLSLKRSTKQDTCVDVGLENKVDNGINNGAKTISEDKVSSPIIPIKGIEINSVIDSQNIIANNDNYSVSLSCFDNLGMFFKYNIGLGNICIIGKEEEIADLANHIIQCFSQHNYNLELVTPEEFLRAGRSFSFKSRNFLILIDLDKITGNRVWDIIDYCSTKLMWLH